MYLCLFFCVVGVSIVSLIVFSEVGVSIVSLFVVLFLVGVRGIDCISVCCLCSRGIDCISVCF